MSGKDPIFAVAGVSKRFANVEALAEVDLAVPEGGVLGLIGPNGSGKTTLFNVMTGLLASDRGRIYFRGTEVTGWPPHRIARAGLGRTFQELRLFKRMRVLDHLLGGPKGQGAAALLPVSRSARAMANERRQRCFELLDWVGLTRKADHLAFELSLGEQRRLELARALAGNADLVLLDEPAGGMTPRETDAMAQLIRSVAQAGRTVVLIEHKMKMVMNLSNRIAVLNFGQKIAEGTVQEVYSDPDVREAYLGNEANIA